MPWESRENREICTDGSFPSGLGKRNTMFSPVFEELELSSVQPLGVVISLELFLPKSMEGKW